MSKRKSNELIEELLGDCASVNDCTGLFQKVALDPDEVKKFHKMYNKIDGNDSID